MTLLLKQIFAFFKLLNSDTGQNSLAIGLSLGIVLGFSPTVSLQTLLVFIILFFFRIQMGAAFISAFFFKLIAYLVDPVADQIGRFVLEHPSLKNLFVEMYNMPLVPLTRFNNSIVMGSGLMGFILAFFSFFIFRILIYKYRELILNRFQQTLFWKSFAATSIYKWYTTYDSLYGKN